MSLFADTMLKAISDYRLLLRKHLSQPDRMRKLEELRLKAYDDENEEELFRMGWSITQDIESNLSDHSRGYYAYSGVRKFGEVLRSFLMQYGVDGGEVIHKAQKAARAMLLTIQLVSLPVSALTLDKECELKSHARFVAMYGSDEQRLNFERALGMGAPEAGGFYGRVLTYYHDQLADKGQYDEAV